MEEFVPSTDRLLQEISDKLSTLIEISKDIREHTGQGRLLVEHQVLPEVKALVGEVQSLER